MAVWYLDNDDEITDAVARLRDTIGDHVVFVVPPGSRIATGRINFKLLAREAESRDLRMAIASPDEQVRALATSAGVLSNATPDGAEAALERGDEPPQPAVEPEPAETTVAAVEADTDTASRRWPSRGRLTAATLGVLGVVIVGGYAAAPSVSTADIELTPATAPLGPLLVPILATTAVASPDPGSGRIPALQLAIPLESSGTFEATGVESIETRAGGEVTFSSPDQEFDQEIVAGTRLQTPAGVEFRTTRTVTLPRSVGGAPSEVTVPVAAIEPGDGGNVAAGAISVVPSLQGQGISVRNPEATSGGRIDQTPIITAADYDDAAVDLQNRLPGSLAAYLREPSDVPPGHVLFAETARQGTVELTPPAEAVVGTGADSFELTAAMVATALAVDPDLATEVVASQLDAAVEADQRVFPGSVAITVSEGVAESDGIAFEGTAEAVVYPIVDGDALAAEIAGLPIPDAQAILEAVGQSTVNVWPGFVTDVPSDLDRIRLEVREPSTPE